MQPIQAHISLQYISQLPPRLGPCHPCLTALHFKVAPHLGLLSPMPHCNTFHNYPLPWAPVTYASLQYISQLPLTLGPCHPCLTAMHFTVAPLPWVPVTHASLQCISQLPPCCGPLSPMPHCTTFHSYPLALGPCHPCLTALHFTVAPGCWPVTRGTRSKMA